MRHNPFVIAGITTVLFAGTLGVLIAVTGFGVIRIVEDMLEAVGVLPLRWGENNVLTLAYIAGGGEESQCGWLTDKFGLSWQIVPEMLPEFLSDPAKAERVMAAVMKMKKLDLATMKKAAAG